MKTYLCILFALIIHCDLFSQKNADKILFNAKLNTIELRREHLTPEDFIYIPEILEDTSFCEATFVESRGFDGVKFIEVKYIEGILIFFSNNRADIICNDNWEKSLKSLHRTKSEFILAYDGQKFYKIKGFVENDFNDLFNRYRLNGDKKSLKNKKLFLETFYIEGVDMECVFMSYLRGKYNVKKYPCQRASLYRMSIIPFIR